MYLSEQEEFSPTSSVQAWIDRVPTPKKRKARNDENVPARTPRKRHRAPLQDVSHNIATHCAEHSTANMSASPSRRRRGSYGTSGPKTPRRSERKQPRKELPISQDDGEYEGGRGDADPTPRGPSLPERMPPPSSSSSTRSRSPVKMAGLKNIEGGLEYAIIQSRAVLDDECHALYSVRGVIEALDEISQGVAVIPRSMKEHTHPNHRREFFPHNFDDDGKRDNLGEAPNISRATQLSELTNEYEQTQESEEGWNCEVQWPIARLALELSAHANRLKLKNITRARIQPSSLAPSRASGSKLDARMVDFAYVLTPNQAIEAGYRNLDLDAGAPLESFNQSCFNTIADKPLAISIETKPSHIAGDAALPQLSVWLHAHFAKLRRLIAAARLPTTELIALPPLLVIVAHGANWRFLVVTQDALGRSTLWRYPREITTSTTIGVFQVVRALQVVLDWAEKQYRPWFEREALPLTPEQRLEFHLGGN